MKRTSRKNSFILCCMVYLIASAAGYAVFHVFDERGTLMATLLADIAATIVVWFSGILMKNASLYDPYWSVAPLVILPVWLVIRGTAVGIADLLFIIAVYAWGLRLTYNWANRWEGLSHQDWRYTMLKEKNPRMYFFTNLVGINLMPTLLVFMGLVPAFYAVRSDGDMGVLTYLGFSICIGATVIQGMADRQMEAFKKRNTEKGRHIDTGLWRVSRHPNYFGEVLFWWGIWLMQKGIVPVWLTLFGPIAITLLYVFVSIPMMERHVAASRPGYAAYKKEVPMLVPFFKTLFPRRGQD